MHSIDTARSLPPGPARTVILAALAIAFTCAGGGFSAALAQEARDDAQPIENASDIAKKDQRNLSHCTPNNQTVTFHGVTTWDLCFSAVSRYGLIIQLAEFRREPAAPFIRVLFDGRFSEIFVPYHAGTPRFFDIGGGPSHPLLALSSADCPPPRTIIGGGLVCREVRDRGLFYKDDALVQRGEELVLWSVLDAGNYNYIQEWSFRDDGSIAGRAGATGPKNGGPNDTRGHMHAFTWRLDIDLGGAGGDSVHLTKHVEDLTANPSTATDSEVLITTEAGLGWSPREFSSLDIGDDVLQNGNGRATSYELVPPRDGVGRHTEGFTKNVFWVTAANDAQLLARNLTTYVNGQNVASADVVVWHTASAHHEEGMRDEDRDTVPVKWVGWELVPQNLFDRTPFFP